MTALYIHRQQTESPTTASGHTQQYNDTTPAVGACLPAMQSVHVDWPEAPEMQTQGGHPSEKGRSREDAADQHTAIRCGGNSHHPLSIGTTASHLVWTFRAGRPCTLQLQMNLHRSVRICQQYTGSPSTQRRLRCRNKQRTQVRGEDERRRRLPSSMHARSARIPHQSKMPCLTQTIADAPGAGANMPETQSVHSEAPEGRQREDISVGWEGRAHKRR